MGFYKVDQLTAKTIAENLQLRLLHVERMSMIFFRGTQGSVVPEHAHPHEQLGTVTKGALEVDIAGEKQHVRSGQVYHIPSNVKHSAVCLEPDTEFLEVFAPRREDLAGS